MNKGYAQFSMRNVAAEAGMRLGNVQYYFPTRSDLVRGGRIGEASPAGGFWLEIAGASIALTAAVALAMLLRRRVGARDVYQR